MRVKEYLELTQGKTAYCVYKESNGQRWMWYSTEFPSPMEFADVNDLVIYRIENEHYQVMHGDCVCTNLYVRDETPTEKIKRLIPWERMDEIASKCMDGMFEAEPYDAVEFCRERDMSETEIDFLVSEEHKKYFEEDKYDYDYEEEWSDGSEIGCKDCPDDECNGHCMSCAYRPI